MKITLTVGCLMGGVFWEGGVGEGVIVLGGGASIFWGLGCGVLCLRGKF